MSEKNGFGVNIPKQNCLKTAFDMKDSCCCCSAMDGLSSEISIFLQCCFEQKTANPVKSPPIRRLPRELHGKHNKNEFRPVNENAK